MKISDLELKLTPSFNDFCNKLITANKNKYNVPLGFYSLTPPHLPYQMWKFVNRWQKELLSLSGVNEDLMGPYEGMR